MESIFLILSGVILAAGVLYWFWSHIQLTQKKVQLLESAVFELRGLLTPLPSGPDAPKAPEVPAPKAPEAEAEAEADEDWAASPAAEEFKSTPLEHLETLETVNLEDLQPGGGAKVGETEGQDGFRELFIQHDPPVASPSKPAETSPESLDAMPVRELRRLAEQRGLTNVSDMRKKELLAALRQQIEPAPAPAPAPAPVPASVTVERIVDLEENTDA